MMRTHHHHRRQNPEKTQYRNAQNIDEENPADLTIFVRGSIHFCSRIFYHLCGLMDACFFDCVSDLDHRCCLDWCWHSWWDKTQEEAAYRTQVIDEYYNVVQVGLQHFTIACTAETHHHCRRCSMVILSWSLFSCLIWGYLDWIKCTIYNV